MIVLLHSSIVITYSNNNSLRKGTEKLKLLSSSRTYSVTHVGHHAVFECIVAVEKTGWHLSRTDHVHQCSDDEPNLDHFIAQLRILDGAAGPIEIQLVHWNDEPSTEVHDLSEQKKVHTGVSLGLARHLSQKYFFSEKNTNN